MRQFEAVFGVTPHQYRIQTRVDTARELLSAGSHSVTDVGLEVGFSSLGSKAAVNLTPGCLTLMSHLPPGAFARADRNVREASGPAAPAHSFPSLKEDGEIADTCGNLIQLYQPV